MSFSKTVGVYPQVSSIEKTSGSASLRSYSPTDIVDMITGRVVSGVAGSGLADPGSNGIIKRTALNVTSVATAGTDYYNPGGTDVAVADGGTNISSYSVGDLLYASSSTVLSKLTAGSSGTVLTITGGIPSWQTGSSAATDATITFSDITTNNASTTKHGFAPKLPNNASLFYNGTGGFTSVSGAGSSLTTASLGATTALSANYLYTGAINTRSFTLPTASSNLGAEIRYVGIAAANTDISWPASTVRSIGSTGYVSTSLFNSGNLEFGLEALGGDWFLIDSSNISGSSSGGSDATLTFSDITTNNSSTGKHGFLPKLTGVSSMYLNGTGGWSTPAGGGTGLADPGSNGLLKRTALNTTTAAVAETDYTSPSGSGVMAGNSYDYSADLTNNAYNGNRIVGLNAGEALIAWDAVYLTTGSQWKRSTASGTAASPARGLAVTSYSSGNSAAILTYGTVRNNSWSWTPGAPIYLGSTTGTLTQTVPAISGYQAQQVGYALSSGVGYFNFTNEYLTLS